MLRLRTRPLMSSGEAENNRAARGGDKFELAGYRPARRKKSLCRIRQTACIGVPYMFLYAVEGGGA